MERVGPLLLAWYACSGRKLPWRRSRSPYRVWLSEIMLQQTRVDTARPYFLRFLKQFPNLRALAAAPLGKVLKAWEGLGYYTRARNLHLAAKVLVARHGGRFPRTAGELRKLPGIGAYTAGAIASIAFGQNEPVLDGNVARVLCRLFRMEEDPRKASARERLWELARSLLPAGGAGDFNQAIMDLGATVCTPLGWQCDRCPLAVLCKARRLDLQGRLPMRTKAKALPHYRVAAAVIFRAGRVLIDLRKPQGLLGGLWEFPGGKVQKGETLQQAAARETREEVGVEIAVEKPLAVVRHAYSHFRITMYAFVCSWRSGTARAIECDAVKWVFPGALGRYAFPKATLRVIEAMSSCKQRALGAASSGAPLPVSSSQGKSHAKRPSRGRIGE